MNIKEIFKNLTKNAKRRDMESDRYISAETYEESIINEALDKHWEELFKRGYDVAALFVQGSQNYGLAEYSEEYRSDVDTKAIVIPSLEDFVKGTAPVSTTIVLDNNEHIDVKDIRLMFSNFQKMNISYIELLYTNYKRINPKYETDIMRLIEARDDIAAINNVQFVKCIYGMALEKRKALCHPYPTILDKIEKYGYDGKQLSHCARLYYFLEDYIGGSPLAACYRPDPKQKEILMNYKKFKNTSGELLSCAQAILDCDHYVSLITDLKEEFVDKHSNEKINEKGIQILDDIKYKIMFKKVAEAVEINPIASLSATNPANCRAMSDYYRGVKNKIQLERIYNEIDKTVKEGEYEVQMSGIIAPENASELRSRAFKVKQYYGSEENNYYSCYVIKW